MILIEVFTTGIVMVFLGLILTILSIKITMIPKSMTIIEVTRGITRNRIKTIISEEIPITILTPIGIGIGKTIDTRGTIGIKPLS
jgi:hypothetical protein